MDYEVVPMSKHEWIVLIFVFINIIYGGYVMYSAMTKYTFCCACTPPLLFRYTIYALIIATALAIIIIISRILNT